jgi:replicative DNA helicase
MLGGRERAAGDCAAVKDIVLDVMSDVAQATRTRGQIAGLSTGFYDLDQKTGGFQPAHLVVLAGRPGMGKTAMAMQMLFAVAKTGKACLFFNFEMGKKELVQRLVCTLAQVDSKHIKRGTLQDSEYQRVILAAQEIEQAPLFIQDTPGMTTAEMRARARRIRNQHGPLGLVAADYLQIVKEGDIQRGRSRADAVSEIANELHAMGRENDCTCLALSQLSRKVEEREDKRPMLSDLRDSGGIEQEANGVWFTYRDGYYRNERLRKQGGAEGADDIAEIIIGKQRGGDTGTVKLKWTGQYTRFDNLARSFEQPPHNYHEHGAAPVYANPRWVDQT